jgi:hypothetical protein
VIFFYPLGEPMKFSVVPRKFVSSKAGAYPPRPHVKHGAIVPPKSNLPVIRFRLRLPRPLPLLLWT